MHCKDNNSPSLYSTSLFLFYENILKPSCGASHAPNDTVLKVVIQTMLDFIRLEREGDAIDKSMLKECTRMLEALFLSDLEAQDQQLYAISFEPAFLASSREYYRAEGERHVRESDAGTYCRLATKRIEEETDRCQTSLTESTAPAIVEVVCQELIKNKIKDIIETDTGVKFMIDNDHTDDLGKMYSLNVRVDPRATELVKAVQQRISELGQEINKDALTDRGDGIMYNQSQAAISWVEQVLALKDRFDKIWKVAFQSNRLIQASMTTSFRDFINSPTFSRASEYISLFIDEYMKKGVREKSEDQVETVLNNAVTLLRYIQDRDMFERYYKKHLGRRLLMNKMGSAEAEKQMIGKMKIELGYSFTSKLEAMFKDMTISVELTDKFKKHVANSDLDQKPVELGVSVLTSRTWPLDGASAESRQGQVAYPKQINGVMDRFNLFYQKQHTGRKLYFQAGMGTADLRARFKPGGKERMHELNVSTYAMIVLLLFNDVPLDQSLSFTEIQSATGIPANDLKRNLQSLAVASKSRVLRKVPMSKEINDTDKFYYNVNFKSSYTRIKVGVVAASNRIENERERLITEAKRDEDRAHVCEAAIVRIMKQRKTLTHSALITEVITHLTHFKPEVSLIKMRIESLIEREFLERAGDSNSYNYLA